MGVPKKWKRTIIRNVDDAVPGAFYGVNLVGVGNASEDVRALTLPLANSPKRRCAWRYSPKRIREFPRNRDSAPK